MSMKHRHDESESMQRNDRRRFSVDYIFNNQE